MNKYFLTAVLCFISMSGWGADIALDINIPLKKSNAASAVTPSTGAAANELYLFIGAQPTSTPKLPTTTSAVVFTTYTILANNGAVGAFVGCSSVTVSAKTFTWNPVATTSMGLWFASFQNTACSPGNPLAGIARSGTANASSGPQNNALVSQYTSSVARSLGVGIGVDASNGNSLSTDANEFFVTNYSSDASTAWTGYVTLMSTVTPSIGTVVISSASPVTVGGASLAALNLEIIPTTTPFITTQNATSITRISATGNGTSLTGGAPLSDQGVCWNTTGLPTLSDSCASGGSKEGIFTAAITGLSPNTLYFVRAYGTNSLGTSYGNNVRLLTYGPSSVQILGKGGTVSVTGNGGTVQVK